MQSRRRQLSDQLLEQAVELLDARFGLDALWLFGSQSSGRATRSSDVDLAGLFRRRPDAIELLDTQQELSELLSREVDLIDLDHASPILAMQVLRHGKLIEDNNPSRRAAFVALAPALYEDLLIVRREAESALLERVRSGRP